MIKKNFGFFLMLFTTITYAAPYKLENYEALHTMLLDGNAVKAIIDFSKCKITHGDTSKPIRHILGVMVENFMISDKTKGISISHGFLNSLDKRTPYVSYGYRLGDVTVMPNNDVIVDTVVVRLPDQILVAPLRLLCRMTEGANFYSDIYGLNK